MKKFLQYHDHVHFKFFPSYTMKYKITIEPYFKTLDVAIRLLKCIEKLTPEMYPLFNLRITPCEYNLVKTG